MVIVERIDLNMARLRELAELPGVGRTLARRIVLDRRLFGSFRNLEDITRVEGVSPELLSLFGEHVEVRAIQRNVDVGNVVFEEDRGPILFSGPPHDLRAAITLANDSEVPTPAVALRVEGADLRTQEGTPLKRLFVGGSLLPGERRRNMVRLRIDATMSPGEYEGELVAGEHRHRVVFLVTEQFDTILSPSNVTLSTAKGKSEHRLVVHNQGNQTLVIRDIGALVLEDPDVRCRTIRETIRRAPATPTWDKLVGTASDELKRNYAELPPLKVRVKNKPIRIDPGDNKMLILEVEVPKLPTRRNFIARSLIYDAELTFDLLSSLQPVDEE
jgi:hypothetical protein